MAMRDALKVLVNLLRAQVAIQADYPLDAWIREALLEEAQGEPSVGAWDRLCQTIAERNLRNHGMWVLDEPLHEPRESQLAPLTASQYKRALRLQFTGGFDPIWQARESVWGNMTPSFLAYVNW